MGWLATVAGRCWTALVGRGEAGRRCNVAAGAITAYDPGYDSDGRIGRTAIDVALALADAAAPALAA